MRFTLLLCLVCGCPTGGEDSKDTNNTGDPLQDAEELLLSAYDNTIFVVDVGDPSHATLVERLPLGGAITTMNWPAINHDRSRYVFSQTDGLYACDAPDCPNPTRITPDWPGGYFGWFALSPAENRVVFEVWEEYGAGMNDIYTMKLDGSELVQVLSVIEDFPTLSNGDQMGFWGTGEVDFSPDGARVVVNTCGHCASPDEAHPAPCYNDFYSVIYTMNVDGSDTNEEVLAIGECTYSMLSWGGNGSLYVRHFDGVEHWVPSRIDNGVELALGGEWLDDACLMRSSPDAHDEGLFVNPCATGDARHHGISGDMIGAGTTLAVDDPDAPGNPLGVFSWFRWQ